MTYDTKDIMLAIAICGFLYFIMNRAGYQLVDPGLIGVQKPLASLQIPDETPPDMSGYTEKNALNGPQTDFLLVKATNALREKTGLCWQPIETQYATLYTNPETQESLIKTRITFSEVKRYFARDYDVIMQNGEIIYIQTQGEFVDSPGAPLPYNNKDIYHRSVGTSVQMLDNMNNQLKE